MANNDILINILLDRSGSMGGMETDVIGSFNSFIKEQREQEGEARVSLVLFDDRYEEIYLNKNINTVQDLDTSVYNVRGSTAYYDALGRLIHSVDKQKNLPAKVLFVVNTDGYENASREFSSEKLKRLIKARETSKDWQFIFIGAGIDAMKASADIGVRNFIGVASASPASLYYTSQTLGQSVNSYRGASAGLTGDAAFSIQDNNTFDPNAVNPAPVVNNIVVKPKVKSK